MKVKRFKLNALSKESLRQKEMSVIVGRPLVHKAKKEYMKSIIPIILCLVFFLSKGWVLEAQPKAAYCPIPNRSVGKIKVIDSTMVKIWYAFNADNINDENTYIDKQCLDIGKKVMKYYSDILSKEDNLLLAWKKKHPKTQGIPRNIVKGGKKRETWSEYQYSELFIYKNKMEVYATMPQWLERYNSFYTEDYPLQKWKIDTRTQKVLGYVCQRATTNWRGRIFEAWFAPSIPLKAGPWKFGGLPGLILKLRDMDGLYRFEAVQISRHPSPIFKYDYKGFFSSTRAKVWKQHKSFNENWWKAANYHKATIDSQGNMVQGAAVSIFTPYSPIEKE